MIAIICLDDKNGYLFASRRQSRDKVLCEHILANFSGKIYMNSYSEALFSDKDRIVCDDRFYKIAGEDDICFFENDGIEEIKKAKKLFVYRWNRVYPADEQLNLDSASAKIVCEFAGNSHEKITLEEYSL